VSKSKIVTVGVGEKFNRLSYYCSGCKTYKAIAIKGSGEPGTNGWAFNGDLNRPTLSPSILNRSEINNELIVCHSFLRDGKIEFLDDCTHELAGKTVELEDYD